MTDGRWCASAASESGCLLPWKLSAPASHLAAAETLSKSERLKRAHKVTERRAKQANLFNTFINTEDECAIRELVSPAGHAALWRKRFWPETGSAGSTAALSALPLQSPPDLHKKKTTLDWRCVWSEERERKVFSPARSRASKHQKDMIGRNNCTWFVFVCV